MPTAEKQLPKQQKKRLPRGKPFEPGKSGNPKGRPPKGQSEAERTRHFLDEYDEELGCTRGEAIRRVKYQLALAGSVQAIESLETRAYGKPVDTLKIERGEEAPQGWIGLLGDYGLHAVDTTAETIDSLPAYEGNEEPAE